MHPRHDRFLGGFRGILPLMILIFRGAIAIILQRLLTGGL